MKIFKASWGAVFDLDHIAVISEIRNSLEPHFEVYFVIGGSCKVFQSDYENINDPKYKRDELINAWEHK